jgi:hypothetical protein
VYFQTEKTWVNRNKVVKDRVWPLEHSAEICFAGSGKMVFHEHWVLVELTLFQEVTGHGETYLCVVLQRPHPVLSNLVPVHPGAIGNHVPQKHSSLLVSECIFIDIGRNTTIYVQSVKKTPSWPVCREYLALVLRHGGEPIMQPHIGLLDHIVTGARTAQPEGQWPSTRSSTHTPPAVHSVKGGHY